LKSIIVAISLLLGLVPNGFAETALSTDPMRAPWVNSRSPMNHPDAYPSLGSTMTEWSHTVYRNYLSPALSRGCPCYPSCSEYMVQAITDFGMILGLIIGLERLLHEHDEIHHGTIIYLDGTPKIYDPIVNNIFWWSDLPCDVL